MNVVNGTKPTLESRLAEPDGKLATATKFWQRAAYQRHVVNVRSLWRRSRRSRLQAPPVKPLRRGQTCPVCRAQPSS